MCLSCVSVRCSVSLQQDTMEVTALCFRLLMLEFTLVSIYTQKSDAVFLRITPDRLQHFKFNSVTFDCEESDGSTKLRVIRNNVESEPVCDERTPSGSSCTIERAYQEDSGEYWCETEAGERSNSVNISVTDGSVILESPALPVTEGDTVTLTCRDKTMSTNPSADFYKDGVLIRSSSTGNMTINNVSKSDEGFYKCIVSGAGGSLASWLAVRDVSVICSVTAHTVSVTPPSPHQEPHSGDVGAPRVLTLLWMSVTILMLALVLVVVGFLQIRKNRVSSKKSHAASSSVCEEDAADNPNGVTYAIVVTKPRKDKDAADAADNLSLKSNHSRKPRTAEDEDESSYQPVYSALTISETPQAPQQEPGSSSKDTPSPTAAKDSSSTEQELLYAPVRKATESRDT